MLMMELMLVMEPILAMDLILFTGRTSLAATNAASAITRVVKNCILAVKIPGTID
jgi:hypothetical protein